MYALHITGAAECDISEALDYIEKVLLNPKAANDLLYTIEMELPKLTIMPNRYKTVSDPLLSALGIRYLQIKNYLVFYTVDDDNQRFTIIRFLYAKRNWVDTLRNGYQPD